MRNLAIALIQHEIIRTTEAKAKQLRQFVERLVTIAKDGVKAADPAGVTLAKRRLAFSYLQHKEAVKRLFETIAPRCLERPGGYTRVVKCGRRMGDGAPMAYIEFVDRPVVIPELDEPKKGRARRRREKEAAQAASAEV
jgi:large subunit ribosomal protein L17